MNSAVSLDTRPMDLDAETPTHGPSRHLRWTVGPIWALAALLIAGIAWHLATQTAQSRERELQAAERDLANLTRVSQEHADRTLHSADQVLRFVHARYLELGPRLDLVRLTQQGVIEAENFPQIGVIDADGIYTLANRPITSRLDLSDREHFRVHRSEDKGLFVSKPVLGRATGRWSIQLTRRITEPEGGFGGVAVLSLDPGYFTRFYSELRLGQRGVSSLVGLDGVVRARHPETANSMAADVSSTELFRMLREGKTSGSYRSVSPIDGVERLLHFRKLSRFPMVVVSGVGVEEILSHHQRDRSALALQGLVAGLLTVLLAAVATRFLIRVRREHQARQEVQRQVRVQAEQLRTFFALSPDGFVAFDEAGRVSHVNPAFRRMLGAAPGAVEGRDADSLARWLDRQCMPEARFTATHAVKPAAPQAAGQTLHDKLVLRAGRKVLQVRGSAGQYAAPALVFRDVTHETEIDQIKSEFLSTAAHELRTPMASVHGFAEVLATQTLSEAERQEFVGIILEQSGSMSRILDELLDLARMEARRGRDFRRERLDMAALVQDLARGYRTPPHRHPPLLLLPPGAAPVWGDPDKLRQAMLNVLSNAYKYSPEGSDVEIILMHEIGPGAARVGLRVVDHGIGMEPHEVKRVFERFYRADRSGAVPGTGLGMSIVDEIIGLHEGRIEIDSSPGEGTRVTLWLPRAESDEEGRDEGGSAEAGTEPGGTAD
jgi:signal transduction histidine kinase